MRLHSPCASELALRELRRANSAWYSLPRLATLPPVAYAAWRPDSPTLCGRTLNTSNSHIPTLYALSSTQDRLVAQRLAWPCAGQELHLFAAFDGHAGASVARHAASSIGPALEALLPRLGAPRAAHTDVSLGAQLQQALVLALLEVHRQVAAKGAPGGCAATVALVCGRLVCVASLGHARCTVDSGGGGDVLSLSEDHRISSNPRERRRLLEAGCLVAPANASGTGPATTLRPASVLRVWPGGLSLSRSLGDLALGHAVLPLPHVKQVRAGGAQETRDTHAYAGERSGAWIYWDG